ncbi:hypothetical protein TOPH_02994 [Tolypocladium ophioglossoides CBS 100239]|uniref:ShKT domain-containing protein n=1 Tax=Tolypocladium ophioglossoides (strain CBS 100239) TaxID=1163406 RepID=A0A0L0NDW9_TOLOC|nr:hypothetical protein TOPH_02994 [Tolypocladium ophioglossoides CBS 100239]
MLPIALIAALCLGLSALPTPEDIDSNSSFSCPDPYANAFCHAWKAHGRCYRGRFLSDAPDDCGTCHYRATSAP